MIIQTYLARPNTDITAGDAGQIALWRSDDSSKIWIDVQYQSDQRSSVEALLTDLHCHPLAIQDIFRKGHPPKLEFFDHNIFILYRAINEVLDDLVFDYQPVGLFISERSLITVHPRPTAGIDQVAANQSLQLLKASPFSLAMKIMHASSGSYLEHVLDFENDISNKEDQIGEGFGEEALTELALYKSRLTKTKRIFNYHLNISQQLKDYENLTTPFPIHDSEHLINDVDDRFERLYTLTQMHYDICSDLIDSHISISSHQLNHTMRVLTVITAVFVPLSFLAGVYGMNFEYMPELRFRYGYFLLMGFMLLIAIGLITLFKRKQWF